MSFDVSEIRSRCDLVQIAAHYTKLTKAGTEYRGKCPVHGGDNPSSFAVYEDRNGVQRWACHSRSCHEADHGSDVIGFIQAMENLDFKGACEYLGGKTDWQPQPIAMPAKPAVKPWQSSKPPAGSRPDLQMRSLGKPVAHWDYLDSDGALLSVVARYETTEGKQIRAFTYGSDGPSPPAWAPKHATKPRPLYGLDRLAAHPDAKVCVVEGEKAADAAQQILESWICVTWPGGASAWKHADWSPLRNRTVLCWPDADEPGKEAMQQVSVLLSDVKGLNCSVKLVDPKDVPDGFDAHDALQWKPDDTIDWLRKNAREIPAMSEKQGNISDKTVTETAPVAEPEQPAATVTELQQPAPAPKRKPRLIAVQGNTVTETEPDDAPEALSDSNLADEWIIQHGDDWRYVADWSSRDRPVWMQWTEKGWARDQTRGYWPLVEKMCIRARNWPEAAALTPDAKRKLCGAGKYASVSQVIAHRPEIACTAAIWDTDDLLLGIPGGHVDLRDGTIYAADKSKLISMRTSVVPAPGPHPLADAVIARAAAGDPEKLAYLWRWFGYMLTGSAREERFLYLHGPQGCGKGTLIKMLADVMGDYAATIGMEALVQTKHPQHSQSIAKLQGKRFVYASEASGASRIDEEKLKWLTGRDKITAHLMRQNDIEFYPHFKLLIYGNEIPQFSGSEGMERRFDLVEYAGKLSDDERDTTLKDRLTAEYPAVLHTMIQAAIEWQQKGLGMPEAVKRDSREYIASQDVVGTWLEQRVLQTPNERTRTADAYKNFSAWVDHMRLRGMAQSQFTQRLKSRGFETLKSSGVMVFKDMELHAPEYDGPPQYDERY